jgi:hypothetical protein
MYRILVGLDEVVARFESLGRTGMHDFIQVGGNEDGEPQRVHYTKIIAEVTAVRSSPTEAEKPAATEAEKPKAEAPKPKVETAKPKEEIDQSKIDEFLTRYVSKQSLSLKTRKTDQRFELHTGGSKVLQDQLKERPKSSGSMKYLDPSYHETVQYIDAEYSEFCKAAEGTLNSLEMHVAYDILMSKHSATVEDTQITATGPSPLTAMTPALMGIYQDMHYRTTLQVPDETSSTREYEAAWTEQAPKKLDFSQWRAFGLPGGTPKEDTSMINTIGAGLDMQTPTSGQTAGQGKINSAIFKHFQKSMELLNQRLDQQHSGSASSASPSSSSASPSSSSASPSSSRAPLSFEQRTRLHMAQLGASYTSGLYQNEKDNFDPDQGFAGWPELKGAIDMLIRSIEEALASFPEKGTEVFAMANLLDQLKGSDAAFIKQVELIGTIIGLMIKKEKRLVLNHQMFDKDDKQVKEHVWNLVKLHGVESEINEQIAASKRNVGQLSRRQQERKKVLRELRDLD